MVAKNHCKENGGGSSANLQLFGEGRGVDPVVTNNYGDNGDYSSAPTYQGSTTGWCTHFGHTLPDTAA